MIEFRQSRSNDRVFKKIQKLDGLTKRAIRQGFFSLGKALRSTANRQILAKDKTGKIYRVRGPSGRRRRHRASAPGQSHANIRGTLRKSIGWKVRGASELEFGYGVNKNDAPPYAEFVEFGTRRMAARPSLQNGIKAERRNFQNNFEREIGKLLEGRGGVVL